MIFTIGIGLQYLITQYNEYKQKKEEREKQEREARLKIEKEMENNNDKATVPGSSTAKADGGAATAIQPTAGSSNGTTGETKQTYCGFKKGFLL